MGFGPTGDGSVSVARKGSPRLSRAAAPLASSAERRVGLGAVSNVSETGRDVEIAVAARTAPKAMAIGRSSPENRRYGLKGAYLPESKLSQPNTGPRPPSFSCQARFDDVQGKIYLPEGQAGPGNDINAGSPGSHKAPT